MYNAFSLGANLGGILPLGGFLTSLIVSRGSNPYSSLASSAISLISTLTGLGMAIWMLIEYEKSGNFGGILGLSVALSFASVCAAFTSVGNFLDKSGSQVLQVLDKLSLWFRYLGYIAIAQGFLSMLPFNFGGFDFTILYDILYLPLEVIEMFVMATIGGIMMSFFKGRGNDPSSLTTSTCLLMYSVGTMVLSIVGLLIWYHRTQGWGVFI